MPAPDSPPSRSSAPDFRSQLFRARLICGLCTWVAGAGRACVVALLLAVAFALLDWAFTYEAALREQLLGIWVGAVVLWLLAEVGWAIRSARHLPEELDLINRDPRHSIACARYLSAPDTPLGRWLTEQSRGEASDSLRRARRRGHPVWRRLAWALGYAAAAAGALAVLHAAAPRATETLGLRLFCPAQDTPPYSPYSFSVSPTDAAVLYGDDITLSASVSGGPEPEEIVLLLDTPGLPVQKLPAFRDQRGRWVLELEKVTAPCRFAFALPDGRARSRFADLRVVHYPRIIAAGATVRPPAYTGLPEQHVSLGGSEITAPDGATLDFELSCSMEIASGYAEFLEAGRSEPLRLEGKASGRSLSVSLPVHRPGIVTLQVRDAEGREAPMPIKTRIGVQPDLPPEVRITAPEDGAFLVAGSPLTIEAEAADDYGLSRFELYKALCPYRQHGVPVLDGSKAEQRYSCTIDTAALGLRDGDAIELRAEASDANPRRYNIISSPTVRLNVISEEQYRLLLAMETGFEEFMARYRVLAEARERSLRAIESALEAKLTERTGALTDVVQHSREARRIAEALAGDFPVFDMDGSLSEVAAELAAVFAQNEKEAASLPVYLPAEEYRERLRAMYERLEALENEMDAQMQEAERVALAAEVQEATARFAELTEDQRDLVDRLRRFMDEYGASSTTQPERLEGLGEDQNLIARDYTDWLEGLSGLRERLAAQPELEASVAMVQRMQEACREAGIGELMSEAARCAANHEPAETHRAAETAQQRMEQLARSEASQEAAEQAAEQSMQQMSRQAADTLRRMMNAQRERRRQQEQQQQQQGKPQQQQQQGKQQQQGQGSGSSKMASAPPRFRPEQALPRQKGDARRPARKRSEGRGEGKQGGEGGDKPSDGQRSPGSAAGRPEAESSDGRPREADLEQVPPNYREAVKAYFAD